MMTARARLRNPYAGKAIYTVVRGTQDQMWGRPCALCDFKFRIGNVAVELVRAGREVGMLVCGHCITALCEQLPPDASDERVAKLASKSSLVGWIREAEGSMECL